jgi:4-amino-4-deoxy-L-arabinose transferase-like glycosyltransferase
VTLAVRLFKNDRTCLLLVLPLATLLFATDLGGRDLWDPDEPRAARVVIGIAETGSWSVLRHEGRPYLEKPPLFYWLAAAAARAGGRVSETALRLPSSLAALATVLFLFFLGRDLFGRRTGALAAVVLATAQDFFMEARWGHADMLWTCFLTLACFAYQRARRAVRPGIPLALFYGALGLAALTKGPAGIALPILAVAAFHAAARETPFLRRSGLAWGLPIALLPLTLWLIAWDSAAGAPYPIGEALERIATRFARGLHHPHSVTHILTSLPIEFLPWSLFLPAAVANTWPRRGARRDPATLYVYAWVLVPLAAFALSAEKRGVYLLPLLPSLALLVARLWDTALHAWEPSPVGRPIAATLWVALLGAVAATAWAVPEVARRAPGLRAVAGVLAAAALATATAALLTHARLGGGAALGVLAAGTACCCLLIATEVLPAVNPLKSARPFMQRVAVRTAGAALAIYPEARDAYAFYAGRPLAVVADREALRAWLLPGAGAFCLMEEEQYVVERRALGFEPAVADRERVGHRAMVLVESPPAEGASP